MRRRLGDKVGGVRRGVSGRAEMRQDCRSTAQKARDAGARALDRRFELLRLVHRLVQTQREENVALAAAATASAKPPAAEEVAEKVTATAATAAAAAAAGVGGPVGDGSLEQSLELVACATSAKGSSSATSAKGSSIGKQQRVGQHNATSYDATSAK